MSQARIALVKQISVNITSSLDISPDQSYFTLITRQMSQINSMYNYQVEVYNLSDLKLHKLAYIYSTYNEATHLCRITADGRHIIVVTVNHLIFYDRELNLKRKLLHNMIDVYDLQGSADSRLIAIVGNKQILVWDCLTFKQIIFPRVDFLTKKCRFSQDNLYLGIISESSIYLYKIRPFGDTFIFQLADTTQKLDQAKTAEFQALGSFNTFDFNPHDSLEVVIGFGHTSPRKWSFATREITKVAEQEQPFQADNYKVVRYMPDGKRVVSGDYVKGMGYWPGFPDKNLIYKENFLFLGLEPYSGGRKVLGFVWQKVKVAQIQFQCSKDNFQTSCPCPKDQFWDMSASACRPCIQDNTNLCLCSANQIFNPDIGGCVYDCSKVKNAINYLYSKDRVNPCYCQRGYFWKNGQCLFDCSSIFFSMGPGKDPETCECQPGFSWNNIGKYCECGENSRLIMKNDNNQIGCECFSNYFQDPITRRCMPNCKQIRNANGTDEFGNCICNDGFMFQVYENETAATNDNLYSNVSQTILSTANGACIRNCSAVPNTELGIKGTDECQCQQNMLWENSRCKLNCKKIKNAVSLKLDQNGTETCSCSLTYHWVPQIRECGMNCDGYSFVNKSRFPNTLSCPCVENFNWRGDAVNQCVIDCEKIKFSESYAINSHSSCMCRTLFYWDNSSTACVLNCSEIWDADKRVSNGECSCKNDKTFSTTNMTCQANTIEGVFTKPWVWAVLGVGILFVLIVAIVMIKFCCKFSDNKENKQHNKKLKKNTQPKIRKRKEQKKEQKMVSSQRAELAKY